LCALRHLAHTYALPGLPAIMMRILWTLTFQRRGVARMEWLRLLPKLGFLPHIAHTLDISAILLVITLTGESRSMPQVGTV
jgi:hypothetical protein